MKIYLSIFLVLVCGLAILGQRNNGSDPASDPATNQRVVNFTKSEEMFQLLEGEWIFADMTCAEPYTVTVSADRKSVKFQYAQPQVSKDGAKRDSFTYDALEVGGHYLRAQIEGESRMTSDGKPVVWDFRFLSPDAFVWHRTDWRNSGSTKQVKRCADGRSRSLATTDQYIDLGTTDQDGTTGESVASSGNSPKAQAIDLPKPKYPKEARRKKAQGKVEVQVVIDEKGNVIEATAISGDSSLRAAAVKSALAAKFAPTIIEGKPYRVTGIIVYNFVP